MDPDADSGEDYIADNPIIFFSDDEEEEFSSSEEEVEEKEEEEEDESVEEIDGDCVETGIAGVSKREEDDELVWEYDPDCLLCEDPWDEDGRHQSCSLACGHTFGRSCIEKWIRERKKKYCPQCRKRCRLSDVWPIFPMRVSGVENDKLKSLDDELFCHSPMEESNWYTLDCAQRNIEYDRYKMKILAKEAQERLMACYEACSNEAPKKTLSGVSNNNNDFQTDLLGSSKSYQRDPPYKFKLMQEFKVNNARVFEMDASNEIMLLSHRSHAIDEDYVLSKINLSTSESETIPMLPNHGTIHDICVSQRPNKLSLLALSENKLSIISWLSNTFVQTCDLPAPAWSCAWDANDMHYVYAGLQNGMLAIFDLRQTASPMGLINGISNQPVHTLHSVDNFENINGPCSTRILLSASADGFCKMNVGDSTMNKSGSCEMLGYGDSKVCTSLAYCASTNEIVATYRPKQETAANAAGFQSGLLPVSFPGSTLGCHVCIKLEDAYNHKLLQIQSSHVSDVQMPKSAIVSFDGRRSLFAYGDEGTCGALFRDLPSLDWAIDMRPHEHPLLSVKFVASAKSGLLGCISENKAQVFSVLPC